MSKPCRRPSRAAIKAQRSLIRAKTCRRALINHAYPIVNDGSQKLTRDTLG